jgi:hypothetical protein
MVVDHHLIADLHGVDRHLNLCAGLGAVGQPDPSCILAAAQQFGDGAAGPAQRQILKVLTDIEQPQDGERDDVLAQHQACHGRRRHQRVGAGLAGPQRAQRAAQEGIAGEDGDAGGEQSATGSQQGRPREDIAPHPEQGQCGTADDHAQHVGVADLLRMRRADRDQLGGDVQRVADCGEHRDAVAAPGRVPDDDRSGARVGVHHAHAITLGDGLFDRHGAPGVGAHPLDGNPHAPGGIRNDLQRRVFGSRLVCDVGD